MIYGRSGKNPSMPAPTIKHGFSDLGFSIVAKDSSYYYCLYSGQLNREVLGGAHLRSVTAQAYNGWNYQGHAIVDFVAGQLGVSEELPGFTPYSDGWVVAPAPRRSGYFRAYADPVDGWAISTSVSSGGDVFAYYYGNNEYLPSDKDYYYLSYLHRGFHYFDKDLFVWQGSGENKLYGKGRNINGTIGHPDVPVDAELADSSLTVRNIAPYWETPFEVYDLEIPVDSFFAHNNSLLVTSGSQLNLYGQCPDDFLSIGNPALGVDISEGFEFADACMCDKSVYIINSFGIVFVKGLFGGTVYSSWHRLPGAWFYVAGGPDYCFLVSSDYSVYVLGNCDNAVLDSSNSYINVPPKTVVTEPLLYTKLQSV